jgi:ATP-dependent Clp protease ATP-binding subunit ClpC
VFERFTERARQVVVLAQDESRALGHDYIGTEHLLLGLLREEEGVAARVLESLGVELESAQAQVEAIVGRGEKAPASGQIPFTPEAKRALELSLREALGLGHNHIGTEHVLLGVIRVEDGVATQVLASYELTADRVRDAVIRSLANPQRPRPGLRPAPRPPEWEYRVERVTSADELSEASLDELGAAAWELVSITPAGTDLVLVFKRRRERRD